MVGYIIKLCVIILVLLPVWLLWRRPWKRLSREGSSRAEVCREAALGCFVLFIGGLLALTFEGEYGSPAWMIARVRERLSEGLGVNLVPFCTIGSFFRHLSGSIFLVNIVGNVVMFLPWGFGLALLWRKNQKFLRIAFYSLLLPLFIETVQLFVGRSVDVDDVILNFAGGCLGGVICFLLRKIFPGLSKLAR